MVRHCARGRPPLPSPSPTLRTAARDTVPQRRGLFSGAARTLPGSSRRANEILYIRVRRREGENVLHRAASNDVDNFSVDNPLWITAAAECRLLRGGRGRLCGGSVNADGGSVNAGAEVQTQTGRGRKASRAMGACRGRLSAPWLRFHGVDRADVYIIIRVCASYCGECALNPPTAQPIPRRRPPLAPTQRHALAEHFRPHAAPTHAHAVPTHARRLRDARPPTSPIPRRRLPLAPAQRHALPEHFRSPRSADARPQAVRCTPADRTTHSPLNAFARPEHFLTPFPSTSDHPRSADARPRSPDARPQAARCIPRRPHDPFPAAPPCLPFRSASGTKKRHRTVHVRCRMSRSTVVAVGHLGW